MLMSALRQKRSFYDRSARDIPNAHPAPLSKLISFSVKLYQLTSGLYFCISAETLSMMLALAADQELTQFLNR
jgi:hypothetical protein